MLMLGFGLLYYMFDYYGLYKGGIIGKCKNGVLIVNVNGKVLINVLFNF